MKILVINAGSSSVKFQLIDMASKKLIAKGSSQRIGLSGSETVVKANGQVYEFMQDLPTHSDSMKLILGALTDSKKGVIKSLDEISGFGHRFVSGGPDYKLPMLLNEGLLNELEGLKSFAPLHMSANVLGVRACMLTAPSIPNVAVFDTGFYRHMPAKAKVYAIPYEFYENNKLQRQGAHGISHDYVSAQLARLMNKDIKDLKLITCHIGNGASISAVNKGICVDTSMGLTPLEGLVMGTRSGDIDPALVASICEIKNCTVQEAINILNKESGLLGISGISSDIRDILKESETNERAKLAIDVFVYRIKKYIGSYAAVMGGVDGIAFTAGSGENRDDIREAVMENMEYLGVDFDFEGNRNFERGVDYCISKPNSKVAVWVVPTDEEMMIANETLKLIK